MYPTTEPSPSAEDSPSGERALEDSLVTSLTGPLPRTSSENRTIDLSMVAARAIQANEDLAASLSVAMSCHGPALELDADGAAVQRVLEDLLSTALRRTPAEGWVTVEIATVDQGARLTVSDRGMTQSPRDILAAMGPTHAAARRLGDGLSARDGLEEGNGVSFTVLDRAGREAPVH